MLSLPSAWQQVGVYAGVMHHARVAPVDRATTAPEVTTPYPYAVTPGMNLILFVVPIPQSAEIERELSVSNKFTNIIIHIYVFRI